MDQQSTTGSTTNGATAAHDLFVLTDEQILEIEPEGEVNVAPGFSPASSPTRASGSSALGAVIPSEARDRGNIHAPASPHSTRQDSTSPAAPRNDSLEQSTNDAVATGHETQPAKAAPQEPPPWLAAQMKDPWSGEEVKEFWDGVLQARSEAAAYRATFATPEDARALKELYPGGANEARAVANRARLLEEIDRAYFGVPGGSTEQTSTARADLAQRMLREDPAAFREMVFAGLRALEQAEKGSTAAANASALPRLAQIFAPNGQNTQSAVGAQHAAPQLGNFTANEAHFAAYNMFEKAANEDLERSVGAAITRTIEQALPNLQRSNRGEGEGARHGVPLQDRLTAAVRQDVEAALKGDRQLGEQIAQILSARRFDNETRAQVVRLIDDRARQLVPSAAKRVISDWTHTTLAAHRGNASRSDAVSARREVEPSTGQGPLQRGLPAAQAGANSGTFSSQTAQTRPGAEQHRNASRSDARRLDYRKLSDEQILEL